jgi:HD superfamily phosphohydrolase
MRRPKTIEDAAASLLAKQLENTNALAREKDNVCAELEAQRRSTLAGMVKALANSWTSPDLAPHRAERTVDDPVYGRIVLDDRLATIVAHPIVQRLNHVKQLSFGYAEYPSATHTRLSHSLGAAKNAELALTRILDRGTYYVEGEAQPRRFDDQIQDRRNEIVQKAKLVALLHDLGHGPFGHALDNYMAYRQPTVPPYRPETERPDKKYTASYVRTVLAATLKSLGFDPEDIGTILHRGKHARLGGFDHLIADLIDSSLDVDRMDYLVRDAHMSGLMMGFTNTMALIDSMRPVMEEDRLILTYDEAATRYIEHFLLAREAMFFNCYEHPRKKAAERIFIRLVKHLVEDPSLGLSAEDLYALTDEEMMSMIRGVHRTSNTVKKLAEALVSDLEYRVVLEARTGSTPWIPLDHWLARTFGDQREELERQRKLMGKVKYLMVAEDDAPYQVKRWAEDRTRPAMLHDAYIVQPGLWEEAIAQRSIGSDRSWQIQVVVPAPEVYMQEDTGVRLLTTETGRFKMVRLSDRSEVMKAVLEHFSAQRARIRVMASADLSEREYNSVRRAAIEVLKAEPERCHNSEPKPQR